VAAFDPARPQLLLVDCPDQPGLVHEITGGLFRNGANILTNHEFVDRESQWFFMRTEFTGPAVPAEFVQEIKAALPPGATVRMGRPGSHRIVILATHEHHCVGELLMRHTHDELGASVHAVVSNRSVLAPLVTRFGVPFHHVPHEHASRTEHETAILDVLDRYGPDYLVLAKYMRILSRDFVDRYPNRIINIHHSFLPAFVGSNPYRQAFARGVKIIGATAHFVTETLDEGPIIAQAVVPVDHSYRPAEMAQASRDVEKIVLAKALRLVFDERIFLSGNRTIIFD
jgi:formyltetrahydrofolate deformylase